jgi:hypothetical protein
VHSDTSTYRIGFITSFRQIHDALPPEFRGEIRKLDANFRFQEELKGSSTPESPKP